MGARLEELVIPPKGNLFKRGTALDLLDWIRGNPMLVEVTNKSKYLKFKFTKGALLSHFKFTGWWQTSWEETLPRRFLHPTDAREPQKYARLGIKTDRGILYFTDPRSLGEIHLFESWEELEREGPQRLLGPEVTSEEFTYERFLKRCKKGKQVIVEVLLDQRCFSGIGNYLRCEVLWDAEQNPFKIASEMTEDKIERVYSSIKRVLSKAIEQDSYDWWNVFQKAKEECKRCKAIVIRTAIGTRGVYWCPGCQKEVSG